VPGALRSLAAPRRVGFATLSRRGILVALRARRSGTFTVTLRAGATILASRSVTLRAGATRRVRLRPAGGRWRRGVPRRLQVAVDLAGGRVAVRSLSVTG
jgi:hypothetical protein